MTNRDAMRTVIARVPAAGVKFTCPALQQFFDDEAAGLCDITVKRLNPTELIDANLAGQVVQHEVHVTYTDAELEFERRLSV